MENSIRKEVSYGPLTVVNVDYGRFMKKGEGMKQAELRQEITHTAYYPKKQIKSSLNDTMFKMSDFDIDEEPFIRKEMRVCWVKVPETATVESTTAMLKNFPKACLYKILSNHPILSDNQVSAINNPELDFNMDKAADSQVVRYGEGEDKGKLILFNGKVQYKGIFFDRGEISEGVSREKEKEDEDRRNSDLQDQYLSEAIAKEYHAVDAVVTGQEIG